MAAIKNICIIAIVAAAFAGTGKAQPPDSLFLQLNNATTPSIKVQALINFSKYYWYINVDSSLYYAQESATIAENDGDQLLLSDAQNAMANVLSITGDSNGAISYYQKSLAIRIAKGKKDKVASVYNNLALLFLDKKEYIKAIDYYRKAASIEDDLNNYRSEANYISSIGAIYLDLGTPNKALEYYISALNILYANDLSQYSGNIHNSIGNIHEQMQNLDLALEHYQRALEAFQKTGNKYGVSMAMNNIGIIYNDKHDNTKALEYYTRSLEIAKEMKDINGQATSLNNLGYLYARINQLDKAETHYFASLKLSQEINDAYSIANTKNNLANVFFAKKQFDLSHKYVFEALNSAIAIKATDVQEESYEILSKLKAKMGNYKQAFEYQSKVIILKDSLYSRKSNEKLIEVQAKFDLEAKENEINILKKDNQIKNLDLDRQVIFQRALIISLLLALLLGIALFSNLRMKKKNNKLLSDANGEMERANQRLQESEANLKQLNATKDKFFSIIAHDLKNPFNALLGFSDILATSAEEEKLADVKEYSKALYDSAEKLFLLIENLLEWSRTQTGKIPFAPEYFLIDHLIREEIDIQANLLQRKKISAQLLSQDSTYAYADKTLVGTVLRNLLSNAIKFTQPGGKIWVATKVLNNQVEVAVTDNGIGIEKDKIPELFSLESSNSTHGTWNEKGTGLGLIICKEFINKNSGTLWVESQVGKGTTFFFTLPAKLEKEIP
ncbi:MAG TPA: tetratricopeptide repeat-containing sensor histidine kinase [Williamwhitmania sp.]|nr:tetratricopeptide repeat-containing sensor histidine kinase [Williamwhitmania sp.]